MGKKKKIVILASGTGTNCENIIKYFQRTQFAEVVLVLSNNKDAKVLDKASALGVEAESFSKTELLTSGKILRKLLKINPDVIILAGFLLKFPESILQEFPNKVVNIHPALLPKYGGKGMYGQYVHQAVLKNEEKETGITIHFVNENYDEGGIIFQKSAALSKSETVETIAKKIHNLEMEHFPVVIEKLLRNG